MSVLAPLQMPGARVELTGPCRFCVWAPFARSVDVHIVSPEEQLLPMDAGEHGYFTLDTDKVSEGALYWYRLDGNLDRPDPASLRQPLGVHGPSQVVSTLQRTDPMWRGIPLEDYIIYELHIGTFTPEGTFEAAIRHLPRLRDLGITAIEVMPIAEFPGERNWGYDGVFPFAADADYGGIEGFQKFIAACHEHGIAVILDVVYNHLGPEGNYFRDFGPYFTDRYRTPWGEAINFDGPGSDAVRRFFLENALFWVRDVGVDALRLDAVHAIFDRSAYPFLQELGDRIRSTAAELGREVVLIAESELNDSRVVLPPERGGFGLTAQWADDLHHCLHTLLTGERSGYYEDFGTVAQLAQALQNGWVYSGQFSRVRQRRFGNSPEAIEAGQLVVCSQNHDQVGNRMKGERLEHIAGLPAARLAAATVILSPYTPMLFMGEEYAEPAPFLYHVSHSDAELQEAVRRGRGEEFAAFRDQGEPPDPQALDTFLASKLRQELVSSGIHAATHSFYRELISLRKGLPALRRPSKRNLDVQSDEAAGILVLRRSAEGQQCCVVLNFSREEQSLRLDVPQGGWRLLLDSEDSRWGGRGSIRQTGLDGGQGQATLLLQPHACLVLATR